MIIRFEVENWKSFYDRSSLTMLAGRERQHRARLPHLQASGATLLPVTAIYGANASGKSNLVAALAYVKTQVVQGMPFGGSIPVQPYRLSAGSAEKPSRFLLEILVGEKLYGFSFAATRSRIVEERLVEILASGNERVLYGRRGDEFEILKSLADYDHLQFASKGTADNQLFLTNSISQKLTTFRDLHDWFKDSLVLITPESHPLGLVHHFDSHKENAAISDQLALLDTGVTRLGAEDVGIDLVDLPFATRQGLNQYLSDAETMPLILNGEWLEISKKSGEMTAKRLIAYHPHEDGSEIQFSMRDESDGTRRLIDLAPGIGLLAAHGSRRVFVIDEIDRSLHTLVLRELLETYLASCSPTSRSQLLFTTHDVMLMDQDLLRRDEMWVAERDRNGRSSLVSFSEYKDVRYDKDVRKSYLQGRMGGIPVLSGASRGTRSL